MSTERQTIYIFALQGTLLDDLRREISHTLSTTQQDYQPRINVHDAVHGISQIEILNFRDSAVLLPFWSFQIEIGGITSLQIELMNNNPNEHSIETDNSSIFEFNVDSLEMDGVVIDQVHRLINLSNTNHNASIYIRFPVFLASYSINVRVRCKLMTSDTWSEWTEKQQINIPSTLISHEFAENERVLFSPLHSNHSIPAKIRKIMDKEKELYQVEIGNVKKKIFNDVHSSRIYRNGPHLKHIVIDIDKLKQIQIHKQLLFGTHCFDQYDVIFHSLTDIYEDYTEDLCDKFDSIQFTDYPFIARYVTMHIMDFLFDGDKIENELRYDLIKCVLNSHHGVMRLVPVWHSSLVNHIELLQHHRNSNLIIINPTEMNTKFSCDVCGIEISSYEWVFKCNGSQNVLNKHFLCVICGYNVIQQHQTIQHLLHQCLNEYLYADDCINLITQFVCGSVISLS